MSNLSERLCSSLNAAPPILPVAPVMKTFFLLIIIFIYPYIETQGHVAGDGSASGGAVAEVGVEHRDGLLSRLHAVEGLVEAAYEGVFLHGFGTVGEVLVGGGGVGSAAFVYPVSLGGVLYVGVEDGAVEEPSYVSDMDVVIRFEGVLEVGAGLAVVEPVGGRVSDGREMIRQVGLYLVYLILVYVVDDLMEADIVDKGRACALGYLHAALGIEQDGRHYGFDAAPFLHSGHQLDDAGGAVAQIPDLRVIVSRVGIFAQLPGQTVAGIAAQSAVEVGDGVVHQYIGGVLGRASCTGQGVYDVEAGGTFDCIRPVCLDVCLQDTALD